VHIAMNLSINALRTRKRSLLRFVSRDESPRQSGELPEPRTGPDGEIDARELRDIVRGAVVRLGNKHRAVVVLRLFHEYSTRETADILGVPEGTVLSRLSRAMKELQTLLAPYVRRGAALPGMLR
jgi:RNA polymerase sigma-70 factor, ECF subfamily